MKFSLKYDKIYNWGECARNIEDIQALFQDIKGFLQRFTTNGVDDVIDPNEFIAWMITQPNARGTLYLERVVRHYISFLRTTPLKLNITLSPEERNIFTCRTIDDFERLRAILTSAPNYKELNEKGRCSFSAGLNCYARFLAYKEGNDAEDFKKDIMKLSDTENNTNSHIRVDFSTPQLYVNTRPVECVLGGTKLTAGKWADIYVSVCEYLLTNSTKPLRTLKFRTKDGNTRPFLMEKSLEGLTCRKLSNNKYINTNYSSQNLYGR